MTDVITEGAVDRQPLRGGDLWASRPVLQHIQTLARARMVGPYAVLAYAVAEAVATIPPYITLEPVIGGRGSLNMCIAITGRSGAGKGTAAAAARDGVICSYPVGPVARVPIGSGEGIARTYRPQGTPAEGPNQVTAAIFSAEEIDTWAAIASRSGSTLSAEVRKMFSGEQLGFGNAGKDTRNVVEAHTYRALVVVGVQPEQSGPILDAADGGLPQRFWWVPASDPDAPDDPPPAPQPYLVPSAEWHLEVSSGNLPNGHLEIPDEARTVIVRARQAVLREEPDADPLAAHALLTRLKIAAGLMALDGRAWITVEDWHLAGELMEVSDSTRDRCRRALTDRSRRANTARALATVERDEIISERKAQRARDTILRKIDARGQQSKNQLRMAMKADLRDYLETALSDLTEQGQIDVSPVDCNGRTVHMYHRYIHQKPTSNSDDDPCTESTYVPLPSAMPSRRTGRQKSDRRRTRGKFRANQQTGAATA